MKMNLTRREYLDKMIGLAGVSLLPACSNIDLRRLNENLKYVHARYIGEQHDDQRNLDYKEFQFPAFRSGDCTVSGTNSFRFYKNGAVSWVSDVQSSALKGYMEATFDGGSEGFQPADLNSRLFETVNFYLEIRKPNESQHWSVYSPSGQVGLTPGVGLERAYAQLKELWWTCGC